MQNLKTAHMVKRKIVQKAIHCSEIACCREEWGRGDRSGVNYKAKAAASAPEKKMS